MTPRLSVLITAFREAETIGQAIEAFLVQLPEQSELIVICPDPETTAVVDSYAARTSAASTPAHAPVRHVADAQRGKPTALNAGLEAAEGEIVVLSDGDVLIDEEALEPLLAPFADPRVGAVSGHPISVNPRETLMGYWSHLLTDTIHRMRLKRHRQGRFLLCSGYLLAFRRSLIDRVPEDALAEDAVISHCIAQRRCGSGPCRIDYAPGAHVYVRYPTSYSDWLRQKVRSAGGYAQKYVRESPLRMRSAWLEFKTGARMALAYPRDPREFLWTLLLFAARLHLWLLVFIKVRLLQRPLGALWKRVESTK